MGRVDQDAPKSAYQCHKPNEKEKKKIKIKKVRGLS